MMPRRIAIIGSPRSGNRWARMVLARTLGLQEFAIHNWTDLPSELPEECILGIHWYREPNFQSFLRKNEFRLVVLARHPLDVLLSVLHFIRFEPMTSRWLEGNCALASELIGSSPLSEAFNRYATSWGAENLLSVGYQWWHDPPILKVRYEDLVADPNDEFTAIASTFGGSTSGLEAILREISCESFRALPNRHGWQGRPGLWRRLIPTIKALKIYAYHRRVFKTLGYPPPLSLLTPAEAKRNWDRLKL